MKLSHICILFTCLLAPSFLLATEYGKANVYTSSSEECPPELCTLSSGYSGFDVGDASGGYSYFEYGSASYSVFAGGTGIGGTSDGFHFLACEETGDIDMIVRVTKIQKKTERQAGLMLSDCIGADAINVALVVNGKKQIKLTKRSVTGGTTTTLATKVAKRRLNSWLRLTRTGNTVLAYYSRNGSIWELVGSTTFAPDPYAAGMVASKGASGAVKEFKFDNFSGTNCSFDPCGGCTTLPTRLASGNSLELSLTGYPNPFAHQLSYRVEGVSGETQVRLMDMTGRVVRKETVGIGEEKFEGKLETSALAPGVYFLVVNNGTQRKMTKVVKR